MANSALAGYFSVTHTQASAYTECAIDTYQLLDGSGNVLGDTSVVSYADATGLTIQTENTQTNYAFQIKATTGGSKTITKIFDLSINAQGGGGGGGGCGSETI